MEDSFNGKDLLPSQVLKSSSDLDIEVNLLPGEVVTESAATLHGTITLTNYRLLVVEESQRYRIPIYLIWKLDNFELVQLLLVTKNGLSFRWKFPSNRDCLKWLSLLSSCAPVPSQLNQVFAFQFFSTLKANMENMLCPLLFDSAANYYDIKKEFKRLEFDDDVWKITDANKEFQVCSTYPPYHIIPKSITNENVFEMAKFRFGYRFPSVVWRSRRTGAVILRCSQPCVGIMVWRSHEDEMFVMAVLNACSRNPGYDTLTEDGKSTISANQRRLLIVDARNYHTAQLNRFKGGGFEFSEYYDRTVISFMGLPNMHVVRDSFEKLIQLCARQELNWFTALEKTGWLTNLSHLIRCSLEVCTAVHLHSRPVMVHCTDGWDRTPQLVSLAEIMTDSYYRTFQGFRVLVEREWLHFGHKFGDRCGHGVGANNVDEQSPIFLQFLDCVFQIQRQFKYAFEFNEIYLVKLALHVYSALFGTFLANNLLERQQEEVMQKTCSVWNFLDDKTNWRLRNYLYRKTDEMLIPSWQHSDIQLWSNVYVHSLHTPDQYTPSTLIGSCLDDQSDTSHLNINSPTIAATTSPLPLRRILSDMDIHVGASSTATRHRLYSSQDTVEQGLRPSDARAEETATVEGEAVSKCCVEDAVRDKIEEGLDVVSLLNSSTDTLTESCSLPADVMSNFKISIPTNGTYNPPYKTITPNKSCSTMMGELNLPSEQLNRPAETNFHFQCITNFPCTSVPANQCLSTFDPPKLLPSLTNERSPNLQNPPADEVSTNNTRYSSDESSEPSSTDINTTTFHWKKFYFHLYNTNAALSTSHDRTDYHSSSSNEHASLQSTNENSYPPLTLDDVDGLFLMEDLETRQVYNQIRNYKRKLAAKQLELDRAQEEFNRLKSSLSLNNLKTISPNSKQPPSLRRNGRSQSESLDTIVVNESDLSLSSVVLVSDADVVEGITRWIPDHLVNECNHCRRMFNTCCRKHHCRSCGDVFCHTCSNYYVTLPEQQLFDNVRICLPCHNRRKSQLT